MKAALWYAARDLRVMDVPEPVAEAGEVVIKVQRCGICGTDMHDYVSGPHSIPTEIPDPLTGTLAPVIMGHEISGEIAEIGPGVEGFKIGDRVAINPLQRCNKCYFCKRGLGQLCVIQSGMGLQNYWGGFCEYTKVKDYQVHKIPDSMTFEQGALVEPLGYAMYGIKRANTTAGDKVLITGGGPTAVLFMMAAFACGATKVYMTEKHPGRIKKMLELGASEVFNINEVSVEDAILERTDGIGIDIAVDCTGSESGINTCFRALRKRGTYIQGGLSLGEIKVEPWHWALKDLNMSGLWCMNPYDYPGNVDIIASGNVQPEKLVTKVIALDDIVEEGFEALMRNKDKKDLKIQVQL